MPLAGCGSWSLGLIPFLFGWCKKAPEPGFSFHALLQQVSSYLCVSFSLRYLCLYLVVVWFCLLMLANWLVGTIVTEITYNVLSRIQPYSFYLSIYLFVLFEQQARRLRRYRLVSKMICYIRSGASNSDLLQSVQLSVGTEISRAAGLIALTRRLTRLSINRVKIFNRALIVNFSASHFSL